MGSIENDTIEEVIQYFNEVLHKDIEYLILDFMLITTSSA